MPNIIKMNYQASGSDVTMEVDVYDIQSTFDENGDIVQVFMLAWEPKNECWITAPVWEFSPIKKKKKLKEG